MSSLLRQRFTPGGIVLLYAGFAALWIIASDGLLNLVLDNPALLVRISVIKGVAFVAVTAGLLYLLLQGWRESVVGESAVEVVAAPEPRRRHLVLTFVGLALIAPLLGFGIVRLHGPQLEREAYANLQAIADLKADQIENWLAERHGDGKALASSPSFARQVGQLLRQDDVTLRENLLDQLDELRIAENYEGVALWDVRGRPVIELGGHMDVSTHLKPLLVQALASGQIQRSNIYSDESGNLHLDWMVPIMLADPEGKPPVATVVLHAGLGRFLFPLIQRWPTAASPSAESLLVRREGESVLFLNGLRHRQGAALTQRSPLSSPNLPAAVAVREGHAGILQGADYRGVPVFAAFRPVAGTDWHLIAQIDRAEVMAPLGDLVFWVSLVSFFAMTAVTAVVLLLWRQQQRAYRFELLAQAAQQDRLLRKFYDLPFVGMALSSPKSKRWMQCNDRLCEILGYPREELVNMTWAEMTHPDDLAANIAEFERVLRGESEGYTIDKRFIRQDGAVVFATIDAKCVRRGDGAVEVFVTTVDDITERKQTEESLRQAATVFENTGEGVTITDANEHILRVNRAFCELTGYTRTRCGARPHGYCTLAAMTGLSTPRCGPTSTTPAIGKARSGTGARTARCFQHC